MMVVAEYGISVRRGLAVHMALTMVYGKLVEFLAPSMCFPWLLDHLSPSLPNHLYFSLHDLACFSGFGARRLVSTLTSGRGPLSDWILSISAPETNGSKYAYAWKKFEVADLRDETTNR